MAKPAKIKGVTLFWQSVSERNQMSGKYQIDISDLREETVKKLEEMGVDVKNKGDERGYFVTCKSDYPIDCYDITGDAVKGNMIGNGSIADAIVNPYEWKFRNKEGVSLGISKLIITELEVYEAVDNINEEDLEEL